MSRFRSTLISGTAALVALTLAACGTTEPPVDTAATGSASMTSADSVAAATSSADSGSASSGSVGSPSATGSAASTGPITVRDGAGRSVTLKQPASRVVALEWSETEILTSLGVTLVGAADTKGYATWDAAAKLDPSVQDVGTRAEPSIDAILALKPDLVVAIGDGSASNFEQIAKTVPVIVTKGADAGRQLDRLRDDVTLLATATGKQVVGEKLLADMDAKIAAGKAAVDQAGAAGDPFLILDGWKQGSAVSIRTFNKGSQMSDIAEAMGLKNAWTAAGDPAYGLGQTDVEGLTKMTDPALRLFYSASEDDVFADGLNTNPIWTSLPFVKSRQFSKFANGTWTFGGPASVEFTVDQLMAAYSS